MAKSKSCRAGRFGILNHVGGVWSPETFDTAEKAQAYLDRERKGWGGDGLARHKVVPVRIIVMPVLPAKDASHD